MGYRREEIITITCDNPECSNKEDTRIDTFLDNPTLKESKFIKKLIKKGWTGLERSVAFDLCPKCSKE